MEIKAVLPTDVMWSKVRDYAEQCSWRAGKYLASAMDEESFNDWERVLVAFEGDEICGYCTVAAKDCIPNVLYTPYIGYIFVGEAYRGRRLSQKMIQYAMSYLKNIGFDRVYIVSDHENLYEKFAFRVIDRKIAPWGAEEKIYMQEL